jgi:hypothetical protein
MRLVKKSLLFALFAFLAGAPPSALAGKKSPSALTIEIDMVAGGVAYIGTFRAAGAISDHGSARTLLEYPNSQKILLDGADGQLLIVIDNIAYAYTGGGSTSRPQVAQLSGTFAVVAGYGAYVAFWGAAGSATGTYVRYPGKCRKGQGPCGDRKQAEMTWVLSLSG